MPVKTPPLSVRLTATLIAEIDAWAADHGLVRNAAVRALIEIGIAGPIPAPEPQKVQPKPPAKPTPVKPAVSTPKVSVSVPFGGDLKRKPLQKTPRR